MGGNVSKVQLVILCIGSFYIHFASWGLTLSFGVIFVELLYRFEAGVAETTWLPSIFAGVILFSGPVASVLIKKIGIRKAAICGSLLLTCSMLASAFVTSLEMMYVTFGVFGGLGASIMHLCGFMIILLHFKTRALIVGLTGSGTSVASMLIPLLTQATIDAYGIQGTFLILAGLSFQGVAAGATFTSKKERSLIYKEADTATKVLSTTSNHDLHDDTLHETREALKHERNHGNENDEEVKHKYIRSKWTELFSPKFVIFCFSWAILKIGFTIPYLYLPEMALSRGLSMHEAAVLASALGCGTIIGKICFTVLGDIKRFGAIYVHITVTVLYGGSVLIYNYLVTFQTLLPLSAFSGIVSSTISGLYPAIVAGIVGCEQAGLALGIFHFTISIPSIVGPPIAGALTDATGELETAFFYSGGFLLLSGLVACLIPCVNIYYKKHSHRNANARHELNIDVEVLS